ncbi:AAA family ATPase [Paenibacillus sp. YPG26]|uniref:AAA family ATPase n=1 Tax=Paenibacillus sp. YPG26 TaxID=2878915 RepID=UPI00203E6333|nr:AAA family ATPase [Paenibacillus sp. YPG26]USB32681.1 AAA family ATPase [Paenibacillus sp. YPG26]
MIIWLNGAFGAGKTQTAYELHRRIPDSFVFDPENTGYYIRDNIPMEAARSDFQEHLLWRTFNYEMLTYITSRYEGTIIVPMTITDVGYWDEIVGRLRGDGLNLRHFTLTLTKDTLKRRLRSRFEGSRSWAAQQMDRCVRELAGDAFAEHVYTDHLTISQTAELIAAKLHIELIPDRRSRLRKTVDRLITQIKHIR